MTHAVKSLVVNFQGKEGGPGKLRFPSSQVKFISLCVLSCKYSYQAKAVGGVVRAVLLGNVPPEPNKMHETVLKCLLFSTSLD